MARLNLPGAVRKEIFQISAANTNLDGTGTIVDGAVGAASGTIVNRVRIKATGTTTAGKVALYVKISATYYLIKEVIVTAVGTIDATHASFEAVEDFSGKGVILASGQKIAASTYNAEPFNVEFESADF